MSEIWTLSKVTKGLSGLNLMGIIACGLFSAFSFAWRGLIISNCWLKLSKFVTIACNLKSLKSSKNIDFSYLHSLAETSENIVLLYAPTF